MMIISTGKASHIKCIADLQVIKLGEDYIEYFQITKWVEVSLLGDKRINQNPI